MILIGIGIIGTCYLNYSIWHHVDSIREWQHPLSKGRMGLSHQSHPHPAAIKQVDFQSVDPIDPIYIGQLNSSDVPYLVSFPWWDSRVRKVNYLKKKPIWAHPTVMSVQQLINDTEVDDAFIDVGANVGFMALYALNRKNPVFAIEPISWNIAKICEGIDANVKRGWATPDAARDKFHLYHAAAGPSAKSWIDVTRPSDAVGHFDAASISKEALGQDDVVTERIPLITVDSIIPNDLNVGVVKIDVQGHEYGVLMGMKQLLGRKVGFPKYVFYEDDPKVTLLAGNTPGDCERLLGEFGYKCITALGGDKQCQK